MSFESRIAVWSKENYETYEEAKKDGAVYTTGSHITVYGETSRLDIEEIINAISLMFFGKFELIGYKFIDHDSN